MSTSLLGFWGFLLTEDWIASTEDWMEYWTMLDLCLQHCEAPIQHTHLGC